MTKREQVLSMLKAAGDRGVTNRELNEAGIYRYSARIKELRDEGVDVETVRIKGGYFKFRLVDFPLSSPADSAPDGCKGLPVREEEGRSPERETTDRPGDSLPLIFACDLNDSPYY